MKLDNKIIECIVKNIESIKYGSVKIEIQENTGKIDIIVENRLRFLKNE